MGILTDCTGSPCLLDSDPNPGYRQLNGLNSEFPGFPRNMAMLYAELPMQLPMYLTTTMNLPT